MPARSISPAFMRKATLGNSMSVSDIALWEREAREYSDISWQLTDCRPKAAERARLRTIWMPTSNVRRWPLSLSDGDRQHATHLRRSTCSRVCPKNGLEGDLGQKAPSVPYTARGSERASHPPATALRRCGSLQWCRNCTGQSACRVRPSALKGREFFLHFRSMRGCDRVNRAARPAAIVGEFEKFAHLVEREPQVARTADEAQAAEMLSRVCAVIPFGPGRRRQQPGFFVKAYRLDLRSSRARVDRSPEWQVSSA
ncbi:hypothetical protein AWB67_06378 [Caballeronia terrestris]|uniref:Uncharacterized protein n=1 Tax=Caballeronia terrestris TaxID=1226301 RepID=A0A158KRH6_9BURK|nr:hypothetical protein AWB67_06378 [Caballeronia terrestris]